MPYTPSKSDIPFDRIGGAPAVRALVERFYDEMSKSEPALARLHPCDEDGNVDSGSRDRFALFLIGWLGGPQDYVAAHGHPRLRMRHAHLPVGTSMRDAWMRAMNAALDAQGIESEFRAWLELRLGEVAEFMRNRED